MASLPAPLPSPKRDPAVVEVAVDRLADCVRRLDPGTRALLDLSVRRRLRDDAMAPLLQTDAFHLAWRRARALEKVASQMGGDEPLPLASVRAALEVLPREAWDPLATPALPAPAESQADPGAVAEDGAASRERDSAAGQFDPEPQPGAVASEPGAVASEPGAVASEPEGEASQAGAHPAPGTDLVPATAAELDVPEPGGMIDRLDAFATAAPTLRQALGGVGRAFGRKAVRMVVWRRRRS